MYISIHVYIYGSFIHAVLVHVHGLYVHVHVQVHGCSKGGIHNC